ncbi:MAG: TIGR04283 family arsenosugar biosynthesis glycosyltransferase [Pseudorhodoplanes sp.]|uniref:TIGR04283 family arsenosugar biosynthesis glycosyltransferase n=1 Tax=Pseudorhodoplanes sp. TaxID=1934341 RepID=UPI003D0DA3B8
MISVIVPTFNAARTLASTLECLSLHRPGLVGEIVIADGGSSDDTIAIASRFDCKIVRAGKGRGTQLRQGALAATHEWLLFLHADTALVGDWGDAIVAFFQRTNSHEIVGVFAFRLDDNTLSARLLERLVALRVRLLALPYGDQGLLFSRAFYDEIGGFSDIPLMEDVDIIRRIGRRRLTVLPAFAVTSAEKYRRNGYLFRSARNLFCLGLYFLGVSPARILKLYG